MNGRDNIVPTDIGNKGQHEEQGVWKRSSQGARKRGKKGS